MDSGATCTGSETACQTATSTNGLCVSGACGACTPTTDDANCASAYGSGYACVGGACVTGCNTDAECPIGQICGVATANQCGACTTDTQCQTDTTYGAGDICVNGACAPGNCHSDTDCPTGQICGVTTPNTCGGCTSDLQCQQDATYGAGDMCDTLTTPGTCVANRCGPGSMNGNLDKACTNNPGDFCCAGGALADTCTPGNCCVSTDCAANFSCIGHTCTQCSAATGNIFYVDPVNGKSSGATGNVSCAFKSITAALTFIGGNAAAGTLIEVVSNDPSTNETFPLTIPQNVTVETVTTASSPVTISVAAGKIGFALASPNSGLTNLIIDGSSNTAASGIAVYGGSATATTVVQKTTVQNFLGAGILVGTRGKAATAGAVTLGPALDVTGNGTTKAVAPGIWISSGTATITGSAATGTAGHTSIHGNTQHGVFVTGTGSVQINPGSVGMSASAAGQAYVDLDGNNVAGLYIVQTPGNTPPPTNVVQGVEIMGTVAGNGIHVQGGSSLTLRGSFVVGNKDNGVDITPYGTGATANVSLAGIDLGTSAVVPGLNTLQGNGGSVPNNGTTGVCLAIPAGTATTGQTLNAAGNIWGGIDCATGTGTVSHTGGCAAGSGTDIGGIGGTGSANKNTASVSSCTLQ
jgi:hypothetical protein